MIHILTIHYKDKWVDIQKKQLEKFVDEEYKVYTRLGENYDEHKDKFDGALDGSGHWTESMKLLLDFIKMFEILYALENKSLKLLFPNTASSEKKFKHCIRIYNDIIAHNKSYCTITQV